MNRFVFLISMVCLVLLFSCGKKHKPYSDHDTIHLWNHTLVRTIVKDGFSPPVSSRIFAYTNIASYEALIKRNGNFQSLSNQLNGLKELPQLVDTVNYCPDYAYSLMFYGISKELVYDSKPLDELMKKQTAHYEKVLSKSEIETTEKYVEELKNHIFKWISEDNYKQTRGMPKYVLKNMPGSWVPTPPDYIDALEPHWNKIRPFALDSAAQYKAAPPIPFDTLPNSEFYKAAKEVYDVVNSTTDKYIEMAQFWDCNPNISTHRGHLNFVTKQETPAGHWMGIANIVCKMQKFDILNSAETYTLTAIALADAFITIWDEKYRSNLIRPETYINLYIDDKWQPLLQTPPFPEHTSGHCGISYAAATVLTEIFGDNFSYNDSTEVYYNIPPRQFNSFYEAAEEAGISRFYGGIHYKHAIVEAKKQGINVGKNIIKKIKTKHQE